MLLAFSAGREIADPASRIRLRPRRPSSASSAPLSGLGGIAPVPKARPGGDFFRTRTGWGARTGRGARTGWETRTRRPSSPPRRACQARHIYRVWRPVGPRCPRRVSRGPGAACRRLSRPLCGTGSAASLEERSRQGVSGQGVSGQGVSGQGVSGQDIVLPTIVYRTGCPGFQDSRENALVDLKRGSSV